MPQIQRTVTAILAAAFSLALSMRESAALELTESEFTRLQGELRPAANAPWLTIPWKIALLDAQQAAARENKPIFIWAMDGHPLGCT